MFTIQINNTKKIQCDHPVEIMRLIQDDVLKNRIYAVTFNGQLMHLDESLEEDGQLEYILDDSTTGSMIYERTLSFVFSVACALAFGGSQVEIKHTFASGLYCEIQKKIPLRDEDCDLIVRQMQEIINSRQRILRTEMPLEEAIALFEKEGLQEKADLLRYRHAKKVSVYQLCGLADYYYGVMLPNASYLKQFSLKKYGKGLWLSKESTFIDQPKLFEAYEEFEQWGKKIRVSTVSDINHIIEQGKYKELAMMCEAMQEKKLVELAEKIVHAKDTKRIVLISGPSSAGKTTFSKRLCIHLRILGVEPVQMSLDDFYVNRVQTPRLSDGSYDFENVETLDLKLLNETMAALLNNEEVELPRYDFQLGERVWEGNKVQLKENQILVVEGIHALNPRLSSQIPESAKFRVYINALTHLNLDKQNRITTSDYRLIRRIVRDYQFRGYSATQTISQWPHVVEGENKYIYPYQEEADYVFNTSLAYEMPILKTIAVPVLSVIKKGEKEYLRANRLVKMLAYFLDGDVDVVLKNSILAEFVGNSIFE